MQNAKEEWQYSFPVEEHCHREGKKLAIALFSEEHFLETIEQVSALEAETKNHDLFCWLKTLSSEKSRLNLRRESIKFCQPHKEALRRLFDQELETWRRSGSKENCKPLAVEISKFDDLFDSSGRTCQ